MALFQDNRYFCLFSTLILGVHVCIAVLLFENDFGAMFLIKRYDAKATPYAVTSVILEACICISLISD